MLKDGDWCCLAYNPQSGVSTWAMPDGDGVLIQERQEVSALLDENKAIRNVASETWKGDGLHSVARIPLAMAHDTNSLLGGAIKAGDTPVVNSVLNDGDFQKLRTKEGSL